MKVKLLFFLFLFSSLCVQAQRKSSLDFIMGVEYSYRALILENDRSSGFRSSEVGLIKGRIGLDYNRNILDNWYFKTGIRFFKAGYRTQKHETDGIIFIIDGEVVMGKFYSKQDMSLIEIPIDFRYEYGDRKLTPYVEFGIAPSFLMKGKSVFVYNDTLKGYAYDFEKRNRLHFVGSLALGLNYSLRENMLIFAHPVARFQVNALNEKGPIKEHLMNFGLEIGVRRVL